MLEDPFVLLQARQAAGAPPVCELRPGLSAAEVNDLVGGLWPEGLDLVDDTILWWWSWQNGVVLKEGLDPSSLPVISPDRFTLTCLEGLLDGVEEQVQSHYRRQRTAIFPISSSELGDHFWLTRRKPHEPWTLERDSKDSPLVAPNGDPDGPPIRFTDYLSEVSTRSWEQLAEQFPWRG